MEKILLIEDNKDIRDNLSEILELANYHVLTASNGKEGVTIALEQQPDLIVCDIMMPVLDGYGVLHMLHKNESLRPIPFIFLTAKTERTDVRKGMEMGADDYITKPFEGAELLSAIESRLRRCAEIRQPEASGISGLHTLLSNTSGKDLLASLKEGRNTNHYKRKQQIYAAGNRPDSLYYIMEGKVKTYQRNDDGKELITGLYNEGDFLGYTALLKAGAYQESAEAIEDTVLAIIPHQDFENLVNNNPEVLSRFVQLLAKNIAEKEQQLIALAYSSLRKKVASALITLDHKYNTTQKPQFEIDISRENLAAVAGVAKESLIRTLGDFRDEQLITLRDGTIVLKEKEKIAAMRN
ncbi:cAMP-binding domain of CRP or a regulatory subunit of cAMP-dependent protein kinases [Chitinophaga eiseniae]|uniref:cAMP-binding domain of CRP or a regulatory subunit of cAMP-dependent protein kinases n=1 Tax=Chitinophaga eiseniae TaxID=634771 RepID=A0A1T4LQX8_9BACT|nr:response regulator [Chitinophaga eiseniae]SJZ57159.1 cAMP-binding domain of CRP or a regulatory subunit of cAMP-dependent protein kinases [Chitinophaga eiseniae]